MELSIEHFIGGVKRREGDGLGGVKLAQPRAFDVNVIIPDLPAPESRRYETLTDRRVL